MRASLTPMSDLLHRSILPGLTCLALFTASASAAELQDTLPAGASWLNRMGVLEQNFGFFAGTGQLADGQITTTYQCLICSPTRATQNFQFGQSRLSGIRGELWGRHLGVAFELSSASNTTSLTDASGASAAVGYNSVSIMPMVRLPLLATDSMPEGRLNLYGGVGLDFVSWMSMELSLPGQPPLSTHLSGRYNNASPGTLSMLGAPWRFSRWIVFAERRLLNTRIEYDGARDNFALAPVRTANIPVRMIQTVAGIEYRC